jgi:hypothetical protein
MGELEFEQKALLRALDTGLQEQERAKQELHLPPPATGFTSAGTKVEVPRPGAVGVLFRVSGSLGVRRNPTTREATTLKVQETLRTPFTCLEIGGRQFLS